MKNDSRVSSDTTMHRRRWYRTDDPRMYVYAPDTGNRLEAFCVRLLRLAFCSGALVRRAVLEYPTGT